MKSDVKNFVACCSICQQAKPNRSKYPGLLQPLPVPTLAWQIISMDFIDGLPKSQGKSCVMVVVDKFTKYSHFLALAHPFTAISIAKVFFDNIYKLHGLPDSIVSDRGQDLYQYLLARTFQANTSVPAHEYQLSPADRRPNRACQPVT